MLVLRTALVLVALAAVTSCGGASSSPPAPTGVVVSSVDPATAGRISGKVRFDGPAPPAEIVRIDGDSNCVSLNGSDRQPSEVLAVGPDGTVRNVFVYVKTGLEKFRFPAPGEAVVIDQQKCRYIPRVLGVRVGQPLQVKNGDPLLHNVRSDPEINQAFNQGQPVQGMTYTHTFTTREVMVPIKCDVHGWMRAYVGALEHPYFAVTGEDGGFTLPDVPPGTYTVAAWHERLGAREQQVTLGAKDTMDVDFTFAR
jgi:plastocyanin